MSTKELAMETIKGLPENASWRTKSRHASVSLLRSTWAVKSSSGEKEWTVTHESEFLNLARANR